VLGPITLDIESGTFVTLVGPSGCGKTTLIRVLAGLQAPTRGEALLDGGYIIEPSKRVGLMFQDANLMPWRTVQDNIALPLELAGQARRDRYAAVHNLLPTLGLDDFALAYPVELSGGMAQRAALGRVLIQHPGLLLLDEPFGALDALTREQISIDLLRMWSQERPTVLMVTHDINEAVLLADRVLVMSPRPGQIALDIPVGLPRPRHLDYIYSDAFATIAQQVRAAINR
jgi:NitT/TauT family transport system ATP-binding protein